MELPKIEITDTLMGNGREATKGAKIIVHNEGYLEDGTKFESTKDAGQPWSVVLSSNKLIKGWYLGVLGMKEGGKRTLSVPPELAYGERSVRTIPPNSRLIFHVELIESLPRE